MDTAKLVAFLLKSEQKLGEIYGIGLRKGWRLPLVLVPIVFPKLGGGCDAAKAEAMIEAIAALIAEIGLETPLGQVGISHNHVPMLAEDAMKQTRLLGNNPREVAYDDAVRIYEAAL